MVDQTVILPASGTVIDISEVTTGKGTVERQRVSIGDGAAGTNLLSINASGQASIVEIDGVATGNITTQNLVPTGPGAATAASTVGFTQLNSAGTVSIQVTGTYTGALTPQASVDGSNWIALSATALVNVNTNAASATIASAAVGIWQVDVSGFKSFRLSANAAVTGTAVVTMQASSAAGMVGLDGPIPAGTSIIGALSANQTTNVNMVAGVAVVTSASGVQRVGVVGTGGNTIDGTLGTVAPGNAIWATAAPATPAGAACTVFTNGALTVANVKASAGNVYGMSIANLTASALYIQFYNTAGTPTLGTSVIWFIPVPASGSLVIPASALALANHATGIGIGASTTPTGAGTPGTAPAVTVFYK